MITSFFYFLFSLFIASYLLPVEGEKLDHSRKFYPESDTLLVEGEVVHYRSLKGKNDTVVVMISGFGGSTYTWNSLFYELNKNRFNVVSIDPPPFGFSSKTTTGNYSISMNALRCWKVLEKATGHRMVYILAGHSMGASIAISMADSLPALVNRMVLVDGVPMNSKPLFFLRYPPFTRFAEAAGRYIVYKPFVFNSIVRSAFSAEPAKEDVAHFRRPFDFENSASATFALAASKEISTNGEAFQHIPSLVIWGKKDNWIPIEIGLKATEVIKEREVMIFEEAGHCPMHTHEQEFNQAIFEFIK